MSQVVTLAEPRPKDYRSRAARDWLPQRSASSTRNSAELHARRALASLNPNTTPAHALRPRAPLPPPHAMSSYQMQFAPRHSIALPPPKSPLGTPRRSAPRRSIAGQTPGLTPSRPSTSALRAHDYLPVLDPLGYNDAHPAVDEDLDEQIGRDQRRLAEAVQQLQARRSQMRAQLARDLSQTIEDKRKAIEGIREVGDQHDELARQRERQAKEDAAIRASLAEAAQEGRKKKAEIEQVKVERSDVQAALTQRRAGQSRCRVARGGRSQG